MLEAAAGSTFAVLDRILGNLLAAYPTLLAVVITDESPRHWIDIRVIQTEPFVTDAARLEVALAMQFCVVVGFRFLAVVAGG